MVQYELELTKTDPNTFPQGVIKFSSGTEGYTSQLDPLLVPNAFFFQIVNPLGQGQLGYFNTASEAVKSLTWVRDSNLGLTPFPENPTLFELGDCIHIFVNSSLGAGSNVLIVNEGFQLLDQIFLDDGSDTYILWRGNNSRFSSQPCCVAPNTQINTPNGLKMIKDIKAGDIIFNHKGKEIQVRSNIKSVPSRSFVKIPRNTLETNVPSEDLYIRPGHPILLNYKEVDSKTLTKKYDNVKLIMIEPTDVWTLCTDKRYFVMMNNVPVCTWEAPDWKRFATKNSIVYWEQ